MIETQYILEHSLSLDYDKVISEGYYMFIMLSLVLFKIKERENSEIDELYKEMMLMYVNVKYKLLLYISFLSIAKNIHEKMIKTAMKYSTPLNKDSTDVIVELINSRNHEVVKHNKRILFKGNNKTRRTRGGNTKTKKRGGGKRSKSSSQNRKRKTHKYRGGSPFQREMSHLFKMFILVWLFLSYYFIPIPAEAVPVQANITNASGNIEIPLMNTTGEQSVYSVTQTLYYSFFGKQDVISKNENANQTIQENNSIINTTMMGMNVLDSLLQNQTVPSEPEQNMIDNLIEDLISDHDKSDDDNFFTIKEGDEEVTEFTGEYVPPPPVKQGQVQVQGQGQGSVVPFQQAQMKKEKPSFFQSVISIFYPETETEEELMTGVWKDVILDVQITLRDKMTEAQQFCYDIQEKIADLKVYESVITELAREEVNATAEPTTLMSYVPMPTFFASDAKSLQPSDSEGKNQQVSVYVNKIIDGVNKNDTISGLVAQVNKTATKQILIESETRKEFLAYCSNSFAAPSISWYTQTPELSSNVGIVPSDSNNEDVGTFPEKTVRISKEYKINIDGNSFKSFLVHLETLKINARKIKETIISKHYETFYGKALGYELDPKLQEQVDDNQDLIEHIDLLINFLSRLKNFESSFSLTPYDTVDYIKRGISGLNKDLAIDIKHVLDYLNSKGKYKPLTYAKEEKRNVIAIQNLETELKKAAIEGQIKAEKTGQFINITSRQEKLNKEAMDAIDERIANDRRKSAQLVEDWTATMIGSLQGATTSVRNIATAALGGLLGPIFIPVLLSMFAGLAFGLFTYYNVILRALMSPFLLPFRAVEKVFSFSKRSDTKAIEGVVAAKPNAEQVGEIHEEIEIGSGAGGGRSKTQLNSITVLRHDTKLTLRELRDFYNENEAWLHNILFLAEKSQGPGGITSIKKICLKFQGINEAENKILVKYPQSSEDTIFEIDYDNNILDPINNRATYIDIDPETNKIEDTIAMYNCKRNFAKKLQKLKKIIGSKVERPSWAPLESDEENSEEEDIRPSQFGNPLIEDKGRKREIGLRTESEIKSMLTQKRRMGKLSDCDVVNQIADTRSAQQRDDRTSFGFGDVYPDEKQPGSSFDM